MGKKERFKFAAAYYWVPSAGAEATGGNVFLNSMLNNPSEGW